MQFTPTIAVSDSLLCICHFASFSDGEKCEGERQQLSGLAAELESENLASLSRATLSGKVSLEDAISGLETQKDRMLANEMARAVCEADGTTTPDEAKFLEDLSHRLGLSESESCAIDKEVNDLALAPVADLSAPSPASEDKGMILRYSILNGALELLPQTLGASERKSLLATFSEEGKQLYAKHLPEIETRSRSLDAASVLSLVRGEQLP